MTNEPKFAAVFDRRETLIESLTKDAGTLAMLVLCIYVSHGSRWWTLATGLMFVLWVLGVADKRLRIVLCGHAGEHDALLQDGWHLRAWTARTGYATTDEAVNNSASETLWCSPHCVPERAVQDALF